MGHKINLRNYFLHKLFYTPEEKGTLRSGFHRLTVGEDLHAILALKTVTEDGEEKYTIAESPRIGIYEDVIKDLKIKIDYKH